MDEAAPTRNGYNRLDGIQEPEDASGKRRTHAWVSVTELQLVFKHNPWKANNLRAALEVLQNPDRVFKHIRPGVESSGWCFSKELKQLWSADGRQRTPARPNTVFTVFLNADCSVFEWGSDIADPQDAKSPDGARKGMGTLHGRFGAVVWERI